MGNAIPGNTPDPLKAKLRAILKFGNEFSLRKRINDVLDSISDAAFQLLSSQGRSALCTRIVDARNFWTHHPLDAADAPLKGRDLATMNMRLKVLLHIVLLKEVGFDETLIVERIRNHPSLGFQAERARTSSV